MRNVVLLGYSLLMGSEIKITSIEFVASARETSQSWAVDGRSKLNQHTKPCLIGFQGRLPNVVGRRLRPIFGRPVHGLGGGGVGVWVVGV